MAEILIRVVPHAHSTRDTAHLHVGKYEAVCIQDDGWQWSQRELSNPDWRIIRVANTTAAQLSAWVESHLTLDGDIEHKRVRRIDNQDIRVQSMIDSWQSGVVNDIASDDRTRLTDAVIDKRTP